MKGLLESRGEDGVVGRSASVVVEDEGGERRGEVERCDEFLVEGNEARRDLVIKKV